jgi:hypothetical protein
VAFQINRLTPAGQGQVIANGATIWTAVGVPEAWVTTGAATPTLVRPSDVASFPAGTAMYRIDLESGVAWCAPFDPTKGMRLSACVRDFDNDNQADGVYVAEARGIKARHLPDVVRGLVGMGYKVPLTPMETPLDVELPVEARIEGSRRGWPRVRLYVDGERLDTLETCTPVPERGPDVCTVSGVLLQRTAPRAATFSVVAHVGEFTLDVQTRGTLERDGMSR